MKTSQTNKTFSLGGYHRRLLRVELTHGVIRSEDIPPDILRAFIGGTGLGIYLLYSEVPPRTAPFASENKLIFATGPLTGTLVPGSGTYTVLSKSPLTGFAAAAQANGFLGARLKAAGYDAVVLEGDGPVPLHPDRIDDFKAAVLKWRKEASATGLGKTVHEKGTLGLFKPYHDKGWVPVKNLTTNQLPEDAPCLSACPEDAIGEDLQQGRIVRVDTELCTGCGQCARACPFGAIKMNPASHKAYKCELCDGDPACAAICPSGAIGFAVQEPYFTRDFALQMRAFSLLKDDSRKQ
jgi:aldehyde:ferredoxin oxidoreductase